MRTLHNLIWLFILGGGMVGCDGVSLNIEAETAAGHAEDIEPEAPKGPHHGRLLIDGDFALELSIFETGVPPEFRVWVTSAGEAIPPSDIDLHITLTRLGDLKDEIGFVAQEDFLRGDLEIYEPHSFVVSVKAIHLGAIHEWQYDNFEGRTQINSNVASSFELETELVGPARIQDVVTVYGRIEPDQERRSTVSARFEGSIKSVLVSIGERVKKGQTLARVESNESLKAYSLRAPISGTVVRRDANPGEQTEGRPLFSIIDTQKVWAQLALFPSVRDRIHKGAAVTIRSADGRVIRKSAISRINPIAESNQSVLATVIMDNADGALIPGTYITADIRIAEYEVPLAVKRTALQSFRDFTVVYVQIGDQYEVRMLELGRQDADRIEVLSGIRSGDRYVTINSYLIKADVEKSGASHDH